MGCSVDCSYISFFRYVSSAGHPKLPIHLSPPFFCFFCFSAIRLLFFTHPIRTACSIPASWSTSTCLSS